MLQTTETRIADYLNTYMDTTENLAINSDIINSLIQAQQYPRIEEELNSINSALKSSLLYVLDLNGEVIISSDYSKNTSLKGNNYAFRKYFTKAVSGENYVMMAVGITTGVRGIYFSSPIRKDKEIIGVMVIKISLDYVDQIFYNSPVYSDIISDSGKIFSSSNTQWIQTDSSIANSLKKINTLTTDSFLNGWKIRMFYGKEDLKNTPRLYLTLIILFGLLIFIMLSIMLLLHRANRQKKITEIKLMERKREIIRINANLEEKIKDRTAELEYTQKKLIEAEKMAALGNLVAGVSHEINTPIGVSLTASTYLRNQLNELINGDRETNKKSLTELKQSSDMIINNIQRSSDIIRTFKQVTGETIVEDPRILNIKNHIIETISSIGMYKNGNKPKVVINCSDDVYFSTYPLAFYHIFNNLVDNTITHGFTGLENEKIEITINISEDQLLIIYQDNGSGMSKNTCSKIFEPFFTTKRGRGGTGLGMHIVYNIIVKLFKGDISCRSKEGKGTDFTMYLSPIK